MLAPQAIATNVRSRTRWRSHHALMPAIASAPAGSRIERVSSKTSLIAAQVASVSTVIISSTYCCARRNVSRPTCLTATPSANRPTCGSVTRRPAASERVIASESTGCTPITLIAGPHALDVRGDARDEAAAADGDEDRVDRPLALAQDLHADRALPGDDVRVVVRMDERRAGLLLQRLRVLVRVRIGVAVQDDVAAARLDRGDLDVRRGHRHHDRRAARQPLRGERHALRVVARGRGDHALRALGGRQVRHLVVRAAQLEREHRLLVLALQQHAVAEAARQRGRDLERRLDRDVVDLGGQDLLQVVDGHGRRG